MGPNTVPCGTPEYTLVTFETTQFTNTCCYLFYCKLRIHLPYLPVTLIAFSLCTKLDGVSPLIAGPLQRNLTNKQILPKSKKMP